MNKNICPSCKNQNFKTIKKNEVYRCRKCQTIFETKNSESIMVVEAEAISNIDYTGLVSINTDIVPVEKLSDNEFNKDSNNHKNKQFDMLMKYFLFTQAIKD